jgi:hypothetical protein
MVAMHGWTDLDPWPSLPVADWQDTRDTLHMWTQIVGKLTLPLAPFENHWWGNTLHVTATGLQTALLPYDGGGLQLAFDFRRHVLDVETTRGERRGVALRPRSVSDFYAELCSVLDGLGVHVPVLGRPVETPLAIPFSEDTQHASYDAEAVEAFHRLLVSATRVLTEFRSRFVGKASPVHFFWGAFDLAATRFSGRRAPVHPGGVPNCPDWVQRLAYSHEVSSCGYWPGGGGEGVFYAYAYPEPDGFASHPVEPAWAYYDGDLGEFVLPVADVRTASDPDATLLAFLESTYEAAAELAAWDRSSLEAGTEDGWPPAARSS